MYMETYVTCGFQGDEGPDPLPSFGSAHASSYIPTYFSLCVKPINTAIIKSARDQSQDIWRLELGKFKNTTFLVKRKFLFLRTI